MSADAPKKLGQYELLSHLATGGMAEIYLARQTGIRGFEKQVVVKRILPQLIQGKDFVEMFFDEARLASRLKHPNIVEIYDLGQDGEDYFIAMEYLKGKTLRDVIVETIQRGDPLPPALAAFVIAQVCDGLDYAHKFADVEGGPLQIVHRDISPNNIILLYSGAVKLVDFGVAKTTVQMHRTEVGVLRGKLSYMSPEQCLGKALDARSDVFSAGVVLWELLAQRRLFRRDTEQKTIEAVLSAHIPLTKEYRPGAPVELDAVARRAMERSVDSRYQSAGEMSRDIRKCLLNMDAAVSNQEMGAYVRRLFKGETHKADGPFRKKPPGTARTREEVPNFPQVPEEDTTPSGPEDALADELMDLGTDESSLGETDTEVTGLPDPVRKPPTVVGPDRVALKPSREHRRKDRMWLLVTFALTGVLVLVALVIGLANGGDPAGDVAATEESDFFFDDTASLARLVVRSRLSGCLVKVNGIRIPGVTPMADLSVEPGRTHTVVVTCIGHQKETRRVTGRAGERITLDFAPVPKGRK